MYDLQVKTPLVLGGMPLHENLLLMTIVLKSLFRAYMKFPRIYVSLCDDSMIDILTSSLRAQRLFQQQLLELRP